MIIYDLHIHSNYSPDATQTIKEIFDKAQSEGIRYISICDHDSIESIPEATMISQNYDIVYIPGVEMSCSTDEHTPQIPINTGIHILGINIKYDSKAFHESMLAIKQKSSIRKRELVNLLKEMGYDLKLEIGQYPSSSELKELLVSNGYFSDKKAAKQFLNSDSILLKLPKIRMSIVDTIKLIHDLGGKAVWAHPYSGENKVFLSPNQVSEMMDYLISLGIDGFEAFHLYTVGDGKTEMILDRAQKNNLIYTIGSDRHFSDNRYGDTYYSFEEKLYPYKIEISVIQKFIEEMLLK